MKLPLFALLLVVSAGVVVGLACNQPLVPVSPGSGTDCHDGTFCDDPVYPVCVNELANDAGHCEGAGPPLLDPPSPTAWRRRSRRPDAGAAP
jgi:hypothetical protein